MKNFKPYSPRMVGCLTCCMFAGLAASIYGQEYSPVIEDRVESSEVYPPVVDDTVEKRGGWELGAVISAAYDDNIFLSSDAPEADMVYRLAPSVAYTKGDAKNGEGFFIKGGYRPTLVLYSSNGSENRVDHQAIAALGWQGKATRLTYEGAVQKLGDATADTGRQTDRIEFENEIRAAWIASEKVTLELAGGQRQVDYADPVFFDTDQVYAETAVRYAYSPKTELGLIYQIGRFKVDGTGPQDTQQLTGRIQWQPREKIRVDIEAGAEHRNFDNGSSTNPVLQGRIEWKPRKETDIYVSAYMRQEASAFFAGQNYEVHGVMAGVSQRLGNDWTVKLEGGLEKNTYEQVSGSGGGNREDQIWFVRPALVRRLGEKSDISLFYRVSENKSTDTSFGYDQQMIGLEFNHKF